MPKRRKIEPRRPMNPTEDQQEKAIGLNSAQEEIIRFCVRMAGALNLPRSVGELFGFLFASSEPQPFDEIVATLGISKGSASQGLKVLVKIGAASVVYVPRDRRTFYVAETSMRQLMGSSLRETVRPHLEGNHPHFERIEECIAKLKADGEDTETLEMRLASLEGWNEKALKLLPLLELFFSLPASDSLIDLIRKKARGEKGYD